MHDEKYLKLKLALFRTLSKNPDYNLPSINSAHGAKEKNAIELTKINKHTFYFIIINSTSCLMKVLYLMMNLDAKLR